MQRRVNPFLKASYETYSNDQKRYFIDALLETDLDSCHEILNAQFAANTENLRAITAALEARRYVNSRLLLAIINKKHFLSLSFSKLDNDHRTQFINFLLDAYALDSSKAEHIRGYQDFYLKVLEKQRALDGYNIILIRQAISSHPNYNHHEHQDLAQSLLGFAIGLEHVLRADGVDPAVDGVATQLVKRLRELGVIPLPVPSIFDGDYADLGAQERKLFIRALLAKSPAQRAEILNAQRVVGANNVVELAEDMKVHRFDFIGDNPEAYRVVQAQVLEQVDAAEEHANRMEDVVAARPEPRLADRQVSVAALPSSLFAVPAPAVAPVPSKEQTVNELLSLAAVIAQRPNDNGAQAKSLVITWLVNALTSEDVNTARDLLGNNNAVAILKSGELSKITENALKYLEQKVQASVNRPR